MNKIFLHLGMHKTATTTLQRQVFPNLENCCYLGRREGCEEKSALLYKKIAKFCFSKESNLALKEEIKNELKKVLSQSHVVFSEEWFTSDYDGLSFFDGNKWQVKLEKLFSLVEIFDYKVFFTVRDPQSALYSFYIEMCGAPGFSGESFLEFIESNSCKAYDYNYLKNTTCEIGFKEITMVPFEMLKENPKEFLGRVCDVIEVHCLDVEVLEDTYSKKNRVDYDIEKKSKYLLFIYSLSGLFPIKIKEGLKLLGVNKVLRFFLAKKIKVESIGVDEKNIILNKYGVYDKYDF